MNNTLTIKRMLKILGVPANLLGYDYIIRAVELCMEDHNKTHKVTTELYPALAKEFNTTPSRIERSIRHAVEITCNNAPIDVLFNVFGNTLKMNGLISNGNFIATLAEVIPTGELDNILYIKEHTV